MHRLVKNELSDEKKESSCFYGTFPESVLGGGTLLSFRRLFAALYIYRFYLHPPRAHRDFSPGFGAIRDAHHSRDSLRG